MKLTKNLVLKTSARFGFIGSYGSETGLSPFNRYRLGGSGIGSGTDFLLGTKVIGLRGYEDNAIVPTDPLTGVEGGVAFNKVGMEMRYLISKSPLMYILGFAEGANTWNSYQDYQPSQLFKSVGVGIRINLPMVGMIGLDYGYALDDSIGGFAPARQKLTFVFGNYAR